MKQTIQVNQRPFTPEIEQTLLADDLNLEIASIRCLLRSNAGLLQPRWGSLTRTFRRRPLSQVFAISASTSTSTARLKGRPWQVKFDREGIHDACARPHRVWSASRSSPRGQTNWLWAACSVWPAMRPVSCFLNDSCHSRAIHLGRLSLDSSIGRVALPPIGWLWSKLKSSISICTY